MLRIRNVTRNTVLAVAGVVAETSKQRRTGLLKHESFPEGEALVIGPCEAVHTFGMKFAIDVLFLDRKRKVLKIRPEMARRKISVCLWAHSVLELPAGTAKATGTVAGDQLEFDKLP